MLSQKNQYKNAKRGQTSTLVEATYPSKVASTGVLQGDAANANVSPARYAWTPCKSPRKKENGRLSPFTSCRSACSEADKMDLVNN